MSLTAGVAHPCAIPFPPVIHRFNGRSTVAAFWLRRGAGKKFFVFQAFSVDVHRLAILGVEDLVFRREMGEVGRAQRAF